MRRLTALLFVASMVGVASVASAQESTAGAPPAGGQANPAAPSLAGQANPAVPESATQAPPEAGQAAFGGRFTSVSGDPARFERYRDARTGPTFDQFQYERIRENWQFGASLQHAGYRDQRYVAGFNRYGKLKASFVWDQIPLFYSKDTRTPFTSPSPGVFRLNDALQSAVQSAAPTTVFGTDLRPFDLRAQRNIADARLDYQATRSLDLRWSFRSTGQTGVQPWGASFGQANAVELAAPKDRRTNDLNATAEWSNDRAMAKVAYDGSWFNNHVDRLIWDSPLSISDAAGLPSQGQMAAWPDNTAQTVSAAGALTLPARTRAFGYVSIGSWLQNAPLLPFTINSAIAPLPLSRPTADAEARIVATNARLTSRPVPRLWLSGQFKTYNYDNRTPRFLEGQYVGLDSSVVNSTTGGSEPFGYDRDFIDLAASYSPLTFAAVNVGYGREQVSRTFRLFETTTEQTARASLDSTGLTWGSMRLLYEHG
ncbi:MAG TPA: MtrB/PioB family outer membrane beta-barrel protein, partial [Povalibacter sp.]|nr:MtrB/PioB family outer membrane beta-barrel protein [Povalibacter sp.]